MPPKNKKQQGGGQSKAQKQKKAKDLEDKTFGLKNVSAFLVNCY